MVCSEWEVRVYLPRSGRIIVKLNYWKVVVEVVVRLSGVTPLICLASFRPTLLTTILFSQL